VGGASPTPKTGSKPKKKRNPIAHPGKGLKGDWRKGVLKKGAAQGGGWGLRLMFSAGAWDGRKQVVRPTTLAVGQGEGRPKEKKKPRQEPRIEAGSPARRRTGWRSPGGGPQRGNNI